MEIKNKATEKDRRLAINCLTQCTVVVRVETAVGFQSSTLSSSSSVQASSSNRSSKERKKESKQASNSSEERSR